MGGRIGPRTALQNRALRWYCESQDLRPQLSAHPQYRFLDRNDKETKRHIDGILADYYAEHPRLKKPEGKK